MIVKSIRIPVGASLSETFNCSGYRILGIQTPSAMTALTAQLSILACADGATPVSAVTVSGTKIAYSVNPDAAQYISTVGRDMVAAPMVRLQALDSGGTAKVQSAEIVLIVVLGTYLS